MDRTRPDRPELTFSANFACPVCGYSIPKLEPRIFSFNNPAGACPSCDGLGVEQFFDPVRVVAQPTQSLAGGAIRGWDGATPTTFRRSAPSPSTTASTWRRPGRIFRPRRARWSSTAPARKSSSSSSRTSTAAPSCAPSRASSRTWSGATRRPTPTRCGRSWPAISP